MGKITAVVLSLPMAIPQPLHMTTTYAEDNVSENTVVETAEPTETAGSEQSAQDSETASPEAQSTSETTSAVTSEAADNQIAEQNEGTGVDVVTAAQPTAAPRARAPIMRAASTSDLTGDAYAVFNSDTGELDFIRSTESHENKSTGSVTSINGNTYTGTIYTGFETNDQPYTLDYTKHNASPWYNIKSQVKNVKFIDVIRPLYCDLWFYGMNRCTDIDIAKLDTSRVTSMSWMFASCYHLTSLDVEKFNTANVADMYCMFDGCSKLTAIDVSKFDTAKVTNMENMFSGCSSLASLDVGKFNTSNVTDMGGMFSGCPKLATLDVSHFDTAKVTDMGNMFSACSSLKSLNMESFNTSNVTDMQFMFYNCSSLTSLDLKSFDTAEVTNIMAMFNGCSNLTSLNVSTFNTSKIKRLYRVFSGCSKLPSLDLNKWDTANVTEVTFVFEDCSSLRSLDLSQWNTAMVTDMVDMFKGCSNLTSLDVSNWDTSKVKDMSDMLEGCKSLPSIDISHFNTSNVDNMTSMFQGCSNLSRLTFGPDFQMPSYYVASAFPTPTKTVSGKPSTGEWGLGSEQADDSKDANQLAKYGATPGALNGTWYAQAKTYTIVFDENGGSGTMANESMICDTAKTLTANSFTRAGYTFVGWNTKANGTGTSYTDGQSVINLATSGTVDLYAQWKAHVGTITYNANGGMIGTTSETRWSIAKDGTILLDGKAYQVLNGPGYDETLIYGTQYDLVSANNQAWLNLVRTGYHVKSGEEWNTHTDGAGASFNQGLKYTAQQFIPALETTNNATATVYANWEPNTYTVKFDANDGTGTMADEAITYDAAKNLTANAYARKGYTFTGWNTQADGKGTSYTDKASVKNLTSTNDGTVTLYAQWVANTYTVSIPKAIRYDHMGIGNVNISVPYDITVKCKAGKFADRIEVSFSTSPMKAEGGSNDLSTSSDSSQTPLVFTKEGIQQDHVVISGTTTTADKWTGSIQYTVSEK